VESAELIVLSHRLGHHPGALQSSREFHQVARTKRHGIASLWSHRHCALEQQTGFTLLIGPGEGADFTGPDGPITGAQSNDHTLRAGGGHLDRHSANASRSQTIITRCLTVPRQQPLLPALALPVSQSSDQSQAHTNPSESTELTDSHQHSRQPQAA